MTKIYEKVLGNTKEKSQGCFDCFRAFYEDYAAKTPYLEIIESSKTKLKSSTTDVQFMKSLLMTG